MLISARNKPNRNSINLYTLPGRFDSKNNDNNTNGECTFDETGRLLSDMWKRRKTQNVHYACTRMKIKRWITYLYKCQVRRLSSIGRVKKKNCCYINYTLAKLFFFIFNISVGTCFVFLCTYTQRVPINRRVSKEKNKTLVADRWYFANNDCMCIPDC